MTRASRPVANEQPLPDIVLPVQFHPATLALPDPERRLRLAILEDALRYYRLYSGATDRRARVLYEDAADWFASPDRSEPFAFENVCEALGLDPDYLRRGLQRWREKAPNAPRFAIRERVRSTLGGTRRSGQRAA